MPRIRRVVGIREPLYDGGTSALLPHLKRVLPGPPDRVNLPASKRAGRAEQSRTRLLRAWRERDARES